MKIALEKSKNGKDTLVFYQNEKKYRVYSISNPLRDGQRFYKSYKNQAFDCYIFIGIGLGYHIEPFLEDVSTKKIIVLEPSEWLYSIVKENESVKAVIENPKAEVYIGNNVDSFLDAIKRRYDLLFFKGIKVLIHRHLKTVFPLEYNKLANRIKNELDILLNDSLTIARFSRLWINNFLRNVSTIKYADLVSSFFNIYRGDAIITGAGPSLDRSVKYIKRFRKRFFLIATDASVKPLVSNGIKPDLIVSIDPQPSVYYHFIGIDDKLINETPIVLNLFSNPEVFHIFKNRYIYFHYHPLNRLFDIDKINIFNYGAVSSLAFKLAVLLGFSNIYLTGYDFSYINNRIYAKDSFFYEYSIINSNRFYPFLNYETEALKKSNLKVDAHNTSQLHSSLKLRGYRKELEAIINESKSIRNIRVYNLLKGGSRISGTEEIEKPNPEGSYDFTARDRDIVRIDIDCRSIKAIENEVIFTLELRNRIIKKVYDREESLKEARALFYKKFRIEALNR